MAQKKKTAKKKAAPQTQITLKMLQKHPYPDYFNRLRIRLRNQGVKGPGIDVDAARHLVDTNRGDGLYVGFLEKLSLEAAVEFAEFRGRSLTFNWCEMSLEALEALCKFRGELNLWPGEYDGMWAALSNHKGFLNLQSATAHDFSAEASAAISSHCGDLWLPDFHEFELSEDAAKALAGFRGGLHMNLHSPLSRVAADAIAQHEGELELCVQRLSREVAKALSQHKALRISYMEEPEPDIATILFRSSAELMQLRKEHISALSDYKGHIQIALNEMSPEEAAILAEHQGLLVIDELDSISDECAEIISRHRGDLYLRVESLTESSAAALAKIDGYLGLASLSDLSEAVAAALSKHKAGLDLRGLDQLSAAAARALSAHRHELNLQYVTHLSDAAAAGLSEGQGNFLLGVEELSESAATSLAKRRGGLVLADLRGLPAEIAYSLATHDGALTFGWQISQLAEDAAKALSGHCGKLTLELEELSTEVAQSLSGHRGGLSLRGVKWMSKETVLALSKAEGDLELGLTSIDDEENATALAGVTGRLSLPCLESLDEKVADRLSRHSGDLGLDKLSCLTDESAQLLAQHRGNLSLSWLTVLSDNSARSLCGHSGNLNLCSLRSLSDDAIVAFKDSQKTIVFLPDHEPREIFSLADTRPPGGEARLLVDSEKLLADEDVQELETDEGRLVFLNTRHLKGMWETA